MRPLYRALAETLARLPQDELQRCKQSAELSFLTQGITFTVYGRDEGTERIFPYDLLPRLITAQEWDRIERGLIQRITALNLFLRDVYFDAKILNDRVVPRELVYSCKHYRRQMRGLQVPRNVYIAVVGSDLLRLNNGEFVVLEDNLRVPSGVSYMLTNRRVMKRTFPQLFHSYGVRPIEHYPQLLLATLRSLAPEGRPEPNIVLLTPGVFNSAYFEHTYLARQMGIDLVEGRDLVTHDNIVYMRTTDGLKRVDVIYRRVDDDFSDPLIFRGGLVARLRGAVQRLSRRQRHGHQRLRHRPRRRQGALRLCAAHDPLLPRTKIRSCPTWRPILLTEEKERQHVLANLDKLVVKAVGESGGYGMLIGPHSTARQREEFARQIEANPRNYIAQPTLDFSARSVPHRQSPGAAPRGPAALHSLWRQGKHRARRTDPRGSRKGLARGQLLARRRQQGHMGSGIAVRSRSSGEYDDAFTRCRQSLLDEPLPGAGGEYRAPARRDHEPDARHRRRQRGDALAAAGGCSGQAGRPGVERRSGGDGTHADLRQPQPRFSHVLRQRRARECAPGTRGNLQRAVAAAQPPLITRCTRRMRRPSSSSNINDTLTSVVDGIHLFKGVSDSTMIHGQGWQFIRLGRYLERAYATATLLEVYQAESVPPAGARTLRLPVP